MTTVNRDAGTGQFVSDEQAKADPEGTVSETVQTIRYLATWTTKGENMSLLQIRGPKIECSWHLPAAAVEAILKAGKAS